MNVKWFCGRCKTFVNYYGWRARGEKLCKCTTSPVPLWYVPSTLLQKLRCRLSMCKYRGTCNTCDNGPYDANDISE